MLKQRSLLLIRVLFPLLLVVVAGCSGSGHGGKFGAGYQKIAASAEIRRFEHEMARLVNRDRAAAGLPPLTYDEDLADVARAHSHDMHANHFFAHESPTTGALDDRLARAGYLALEARENLAEALDVVTGEKVLMASPGHHANIMAKGVTHLGVGIVEGGVKDPRNLLFTQVFAKPGELESPADARQSILRRIEQARRAAGLGPLVSNPKLEDLAETHITELPVEPTPSSLQAVGEAVTRELASSPIEGVGSISVGGQLLWDTSQFVPPAAATQARARQVGLAVQQVADPQGRPQLKVLLLVAL